MVVPLQSDNFKWTAAMAFTFLIHSIAFLSPLIKDSSEPMWINFKKHQQYLMGLMQWSGSTAYILQLDLQIREHHEGWIAIFQFRALHKFKNHVILHGCKNWLYTVPPRVGWCLKGAATLSLSLSLPLSLSLSVCLWLQRAVFCRRNEAEGTKK